MPNAEILLTLCEISVAFAGFASIAALFQHRDPANWAPPIVVRVRTMIECSIGTLFCALLPFVFFHFGVTGSALWSASSLGLAAAQIAFGIRVVRLSAAGLSDRQLSPRFAILVFCLTALSVVGLSINGFAALAPSAFGPYLLGMIWMLAVSSLTFLRVVIVPAAR